VRKPKGLLIDLDGTMYSGLTPIDGADQLIASLQKTGIPYLFVTNNSSATPELVASRLSEMGIPAASEDVCTSAQAAAGYIAEQKPGAQVLIIGEDGLIGAAREAGLVVTTGDADYVLQGIDRQFTYDKLCEAAAQIHRGAVYILTNPDLLLPTGGRLMPGAGSLGAALTAAGGVNPVVIGKPSSILMDYALERIGTSAEDTWVVGDNLATDIAAGLAAGCGTVLVLTGLTNDGNLERYTRESGVSADRICSDLDELRRYISQSLGQ
jgi:4-nitrophenyl phosphatase